MKLVLHLIWKKPNPTPKDIAKKAKKQSNIKIKLLKKTKWLRKSESKYRTQIANILKWKDKISKKNIKKKFLADMIPKLHETMHYQDMREKRLSYVWKKNAKLDIITSIMSWMIKKHTHSWVYRIYWYYWTYIISGNLKIITTYEKMKFSYNESRYINVSRDEIDNLLYILNN